MKSIILSAIFMSSALAGPILRRATTCNQTPTATTSTNTNVSPIATPTATTASACQAECDANSSCESFIFGLVSGSPVPTCELFSVPASQVPNQGSNLNVFDKACTDVSAEVPTTSNPNPGAQTTTAAAAANPTEAAGNNGGNNSPGKATTTTANNASPTEAAGNNGSNNGGQAATTTTPTSSTPTEGSSSQNGGSGSQQQGQKRANDAPGKEPASTTTEGSQRKRAGSDSNICGSAPAEQQSTTAAVTPLQTATNVASQQDCLALCKTTSGCLSVEFGKSSANGADECLLFSVDAASLPAPTSGQSLVAYDAGC